MKKIRSVLAYDAEWTSPELTEQHALYQAGKLLPEVPGVFYLGVPWATLIERLNSKESYLDSLHEDLSGLNLLLKEQRYIVTVCQHIDMLKHHELFGECGVTHVFWVYAVKGQECFPDNKHIKIFPFPVLPVQTTACRVTHKGGRKYLYSFIESRSESEVLDDSIELILTNLADKPGGLVIPYDEWDGREVLPGTGVRWEMDINQEVADSATPVVLRGIYQKSIFSLCPSSACPNSVRLWDAIGSGSIPVVISENYLPPGNSALWELATVLCSGRLEDIMALPDRLAAMACDKQLLERKQHALRQLWMIYGPDCFIYDVQKLFFSFAGETVDMAMTQSTFSYGSLYSMATEINRTNNVERSAADVFILGCSSRVLSDPLGFLSRFKENIDFRSAYQLALGSCSAIHAESMAKALQSKQIALELLPDR